MECVRDDCTFVCIDRDTANHVTLPVVVFQCGLVLGVLLLLLLGWLGGQSCMLMLMAAQRTAKRSFELLALAALGEVGKLGVELGVVGLLAGTLVAFIVIIGDLGPEIVADLTKVPNTKSLKVVVVLTLAVFVVLPLSLLRNVSSMAKASAASLVFYLVFILHVSSACK